jgi:dihydrofolate reductase
MADLLYTVIASLDGFVADENGSFDWAAPDEEVHAFVNDLERDIGTYLLGRRMYEVMRFWDTSEAIDDQPPVMHDFAAIWRAADKVVFSSTLTEVSTGRTQLERDFDSKRVRAMKRTADRDLSIGGPTLAASAIRDGLVDEYRCFVVPVVVGVGIQALPAGVRRDFQLIELRRFESGFVYLRYRDATAGS